MIDGLIDIFEEFMSILGSTEDTLDNIAFNFTYCNTDFESLVVDRIKKQTSIKRIIFYLHVGLIPGTNKSTFVSQYETLTNVGGDERRAFHQANHFALGVFYIEGKTVYYADSLGWPVPLVFRDRMTCLANKLSLSDLVHVTCHLPSHNHA